MQALQQKRENLLIQLNEVQDHIKFVSEILEKSKQYILANQCDELNPMIEIQAKTLTNLRQKYTKIGGELDIVLFEINTFGNEIRGDHTITIGYGAKSVVLYDVYDNICDDPRVKNFGKAHISLGNNVVVDDMFAQVEFVSVIGSSAYVCGKKRVISFKNGKLTFTPAL